MEGLLVEGLLFEDPQFLFRDTFPGRTAVAAFFRPASCRDAAFESLRKCDRAPENRPTLGFVTFSLRDKPLRLT